MNGKKKTNGRITFTCGHCLKFDECPKEYKKVFREGCDEWWPVDELPKILGEVATLIEDLELDELEILERWKIPHMKKQKDGSVLTGHKRGDIVTWELNNTIFTGKVFSVSGNIVKCITKSGRKFELLSKNVRK